jgi:hypothetical protein
MNAGLFGCGGNEINDSDGRINQVIGCLPPGGTGDGRGLFTY